MNEGQILDIINKVTLGSLSDEEKSLVVANVFAETSVPPVDSSTNPQAESISPQQANLAKFKRAARKLLMSRLQDKDGKSAKIKILPPMDYTALQSPDVVTETIQRGIRMYDDNLNVDVVDYKMKSLTLEQFRDAVTKLNTDLLFVTVMHQTNFDLYLYDRRTPYQIYAHSEPISTAAQYDLTSEIAGYYTKLLIRRALYRYIKNQFYELPRDESPPLLSLQIPRYIASQASVDIINKEATNPFMAQIGFGASFAKSANNRNWNSSVVSAQLGYRLVDTTFIKVGFEMSAYNAIFGGVAHVFTGKSNLFKTEFGLSIGQTFTSRTLDWDRTDGIQGGVLHIIPSAALIVPIMDVSIRIDSQLFIGIAPRSYIFNISPGMSFSF